MKHRGLPGWTTQEMLQSADEHKYGLRHFISINQVPIPTVVVILAGTNDLADAVQAEPVTESISALHKLCWDSGVARTVTVSIPPSAYQAIDQHTADLCRYFNEALQDFCESSPKASYTAFPFRFRRDERWSWDGLHLTEEGYKFLGTQLAPSIAQALRSV